MKIRLAIAAVLAAIGCRMRVPIAPGVAVPLPAVLLALAAAAVVVLAVVIVRSLRRDGWQLRPAWRPSCALPLAAKSGRTRGYRHGRALGTHPT